MLLETRQALLRPRQNIILTHAWTPIVVVQPDNLITILQLWYSLCTYAHVNQQHMEDEKQRLRTTSLLYIGISGCARLYFFCRTKCSLKKK